VKKSRLICEYIVYTLVIFIQRISQSLRHAFEMSQQNVYVNGAGSRDVPRGDIGRLCNCGDGNCWREWSAVGLISIDLSLLKLIELLSWAASGPVTTGCYVYVGLKLESEFPVQDLKSGQGGLLQVCMEGIGLLFANTKV